jgi:hypothetical protein
VSTQAANVSREKALCFDYLDRNAEAIATLNDSVTTHRRNSGLPSKAKNGRVCRGIGRCTGAFHEHLLGRLEPRGVQEAPAASTSAQ